jgi:hypothetical protein
MPQPLNLSCGGGGTLSVRCYLAVLTVLCWRLNKYCVYLGNEVILAWK